MTWEIMTRSERLLAGEVLVGTGSHQKIEGSGTDFSNPTPLRFADRATGEIRECESFSGLIEDWYEVGDLCSGVVAALGPDVRRRWADGDDVDLGAEVRRLRHDVESPAIALIAAERRRQVDAEGWTPEHDDEHRGGELPEPVHGRWPWPASDWKPTGDPARDLAKAGALIAAELERLLREAGRR